jgi:hypothetical protein
LDRVFGPRLSSDLLDCETLPGLDPFLFDQVQPQKEMGFRAARPEATKRPLWPNVRIGRIGFFEAPDGRIGFFEAPDRRIGRFEGPVLCIRAIGRFGFSEVPTFLPRRFEGYSSSRALRTLHNPLGATRDSGGLRNRVPP